MSSLTLYGTALSGHVHRVKLLLTMLGLPYTWIEAGAEVRKSAEYRALNPLAQIPVLVDDGIAISDSNAILIWLVKRYAPASGWLPQDLLEEVQVHQWLAKAAGEIRYGVASARLIKQFNAQENYDSAVQVAKKFLPTLEAHLSERLWLAGERATIADLACYAYVACAPEGGIRLEPYPAINSWLRRIAALPGFIPLPSLPLPAEV
ncbi:glutathione S-transferase family protein [Erwinia sorbitola]|uniref:Glutathione S-transferase n=1 Tax=Erwinia sorbitola TaxID=2681984 RepID=A0ABW9R993_9GAMM|nr:glutathione S-transferase [Erwinia sorbitola]MTD26056.1 glutathione S-transferase [Erwinia sorbitola]